MSARTPNLELADKAVRAPVGCGSMVPMCDFETVNAAHKPALGSPVSDPACWGVALSSRRVGDRRSNRRFKVRVQPNLKLAAAHEPAVRSSAFTRPGPPEGGTPNQTHRFPVQETNRERENSGSTFVKRKGLTHLQL
jgi:hypothetical protein